MTLVQKSDAAAILKCLIAARKRAKLTQAGLAHFLAKPQSFVAKYEGGQRSLSLGEFLVIASVFRIDPRVLIGEILEAAPSLRVRARRRAVKR